MDIKDAIVGAGYALPDGIIACDGRLHRFATDAYKPHSLDGWYIFFQDSAGIRGSFGSWRESSKFTFSDTKNGELSLAEIKRIEIQKKEAAAQAKQDASDAAIRAERIYNQASAKGESDYLVKKGIPPPSAVRFINGLNASAFGFSSQRVINAIVVPIYSVSGAIASLQIIENTGKKLFLRNGATYNGWCGLGADWKKAKRVIIAEGIATAQSVFLATKYPTICAFYASNVAGVAKMVRRYNASAEIILAVDGDTAGYEAAEKALAEVNGCRRVDAPQAQDWNDVHVQLGLEAVRDQFEQSSLDWRSGLIVKDKSDGTQSIPCRSHNLILILKNHEDFKGRLRFNQLSNQINIDWVDIDEAATIKIKAQLEKSHINEKIQNHEVIDAMTVVSEEITFHPIQDYLNALQWDGVPRIHNFFKDYLGSESSAYNEAVAISFLVSAVARVMIHGCQVDTMVILEGFQGKGKSSALSVLFSKAWYSEITANINDKDFFQNMRGKWCLEFADLSGFKKMDAHQLKKIITARTDNYRASYARYNKDYPRQSIFVATTNESNYLDDPTGARRYLPIKCGVEKGIDLIGIERNRDQLWAEAVELFNYGMCWWVIPDAAKQQEERFNTDVWEDVIIRWMIMHDYVSTSEILVGALDIEVGKQTRREQTRVGNVMNRLKYDRSRIVRNGQRIWVYVKPKK